MTPESEMEDRRVRADLLVLEVFQITHGMSSMKTEACFERDLNSRTRVQILEASKEMIPGLLH